MAAQFEEVSIMISADIYEVDWSSTQKMIVVGVLLFQNVSCVERVWKLIFSTLAFSLFDTMKKLYLLIKSERNKQYFKQNNLRFKSLGGKELRKIINFCKDIKTDRQTDKQTNRDRDRRGYTQWILLRFFFNFKIHEQPLGEFYLLQSNSITTSHRTN